MAIWLYFLIVCKENTHRVIKKNLIGLQWKRGKRLQNDLM